MIENKEGVEVIEYKATLKEGGESTAGWLNIVHESLVYPERRGSVHILNENTIPHAHCTNEVHPETKKDVKILNVKEDLNATWIYTSLGAYGKTAFLDNFKLGER